MLLKTVFSGFGGQGVLMMGYVLARSAMDAGLQVTYMPTYGAEIRGGTAHCTVSIGDEEIASPIASRPEFLVAMNAPSLAAFENNVAPDGAVFLNSSIVKDSPRRRDVTVFPIPAAEIAYDLGNTRAANIVIMGAFIRATALVSPDYFIGSIEAVLGGKKKAAIELNRKAFSAGYEFVKTPLHKEG